MKIVLFSLLFLIEGITFSQQKTKDSLCFNVSKMISNNSTEPWGIFCSENCEIRKFNFQLFNRWGTVLFEANSLSQANSFNLNENPKTTIETGTYIWKITFSLVNDKQQYTEQGTLTIVK
jgi:hypothetical protein